MLALATLILLKIPLDPEVERSRLLREIDRDRDQKITVLDQRDRRPMRYTLRSKSGANLDLQGAWTLSNLLQELTLAVRNKSGHILGERIFENPVERISRSIRDRYWAGLTRSIDSKHLEKVLKDPKTQKNSTLRLYVPLSDSSAVEHYKQMGKEVRGLEVITLPSTITPEIEASLREKPGLLTLRPSTPYVVPGGRFNEMYGWDSYFIGLGLLADGKTDLALSMVENLTYQINHYGKILNANRTYYLLRSQPPFYSNFIRQVWARISRNEKTRRWLRSAVTAALKEYKTVWMGKERLTNLGLSRYLGQGIGIPEEVEPTHFDFILKSRAKKFGVSMSKFRQKYNSGQLRDTELDEFLKNDQSVRESGHDTTYRWRVGGRDLAHHFVTVDLNALLYKTELDLAHLLETEFGGELGGVSAKELRQAALERKKLIRQYFWDEKRHLFFDYNFVNQIRSSYESATMFYPLWAHDPLRPETKILSNAEARVFVKNALAIFESAGGLAATSKTSLQQHGDSAHLRQWEWPNGWAPHQILAWEGLKQYGYLEVARRLSYRWLQMITRNAVDYNGTIPEKYDVVARSHAVFAEYGNVGTDFSYITTEGFGWMNASYQIGLQNLDADRRMALEALIPPEWLNWE